MKPEQKRLRDYMAKIIGAFEAGGTERFHMGVNRADNRKVVGWSVSALLLAVLFVSSAFSVADSNFAQRSPSVESRSLDSVFSEAAPGGPVSESWIFSGNGSVDFGTKNKHIPVSLGQFHGFVDLNMSVSGTYHLDFALKCTKRNLLGVCTTYGLDWLEFWVQLNSYAKATINGSTPVSVTLPLPEIPIWDATHKIPLGAIGPIPVYISVGLKVFFDLEVRLFGTVKVTTGVEVRTSFKGGARWSSGSWSNILQVYAIHADVITPKIKVSDVGTQIIASIPIRLGAWFEDLKGPYLEFKPSVTFGATYVAPPPSGTWFTRIDFEISVTVPGFTWLANLMKKAAAWLFSSWAFPKDLTGLSHKILYQMTIKKWTGTWGDDGVTLDSTPHPSTAIPATGIGLSGNVLLKGSHVPVSNNTVRVWVDDCVFQYCIASPINSTTKTDDTGQYFMGFNAPSPAAGACTCVVNMELNYGTIHQISSSILIIRPQTPVDVPIRDSNGTVIGHISSDQLTFDASPPEISATITPSLNANGWSNQEVAAIWKVSDLETRVRSSSGCDAAVLTEETTEDELVCTATNDAGLTAAKSIAVRIDKTPPVITPSISPDLNDLGWSIEDVSLRFDCYDALSGVDVPPDSPQNVTSEGVGQSRSGTCVDGAGNSAEATIGGVNIDKTPPRKLVHSLAPAPDANGWNHGSVAVEFSCSDSLSGAETVYGVYGLLSPRATNITELFTVPMVIGEGANQSVTGICSDRAGNFAVDTVRGINVGPAVSTEGAGLPLTTYALVAAVVVLASIAATLVIVVRRLGSEIRSSKKQFAQPPPRPPEI